MDTKELHQHKEDTHTSPDSDMVALEDTITSTVVIQLASPMELKSAQIRISSPEAFLTDKQTMTLNRCLANTLHPMLVSNSDLSNDCRL